MKRLLLLTAILFSYVGSATAEWTKIGGSAARVFVGGNGLYAESPIPAWEGNIWRYDGTPGKWTKVGGPGAMWAVNDIAIYGRSKGSSVWQYTGSGEKWFPIGGPFAELFAGGKALYAAKHGGSAHFLGDIYRYDGTPGKWTKIGGPGAMWAVNDIAIYGLSEAETSVWQYTGSGEKWSPIGGAFDKLFASGKALYGLKETGSTGVMGVYKIYDVYQYDGGTGKWTILASDGASSALTAERGRSLAIAANDDGLYIVSADGKAVEHWVGPHFWGVIHIPPGQNRIMGVFARHKDLYIATRVKEETEGDMVFRREFHDAIWQHKP